MLLLKTKAIIWKETIQYQIKKQNDTNTFIPHDLLYCKRRYIESVGGKRRLSYKIKMCIDCQREVSVQRCYIVAASFIGGGNRGTGENHRPPTSH